MFSFRKSFLKTNKNNWKSRWKVNKSKQKALEEHGKELVESNSLIRKHEYDKEDIFQKTVSTNIVKKINKHVDKRHNQISELSKTIDYDGLMYSFRDKNIRESCNGFDDATSLFRKIIDGDTMLENEKKINMSINQTRMK